MKYYLEILLILFILSTDNLHSQCSVVVDTANISHIICPNGGAVGSSQIIQANYLNYSWQNIQTGNFFNTGGIPGNTSRSDLEAGLYVITASLPYSNSCPNTIYSDTFEIRMPTANIQSSPTQACPNECNVSLSLNLIGGIVSANYSYSVDGLSSVTANQTFTNMCGGSHTYEVFADGQSCGIENFGISQFAPMNLSATVTNATCTQSGSATVNITGVGASALNNYCLSSPQNTYNNFYATITDVNLLGDNSSISNYTGCPNSYYSNFTALVADVTPGNTYNIDLSLGTCGQFGMLDIANVYVDWNIDGDFLDSNEIIATIPPIQSPSTHLLNFTVPLNAVPGQSRMRIVMQNNEWQQNNQANACDDSIAYFGETEDYTIQVNGSVASPVTYLWSDGQTTQTATNLSSGTYLVTITDANGCSATDTAIIGGSSNVSVTASGSQTICNGAVPNSLSATSSSSGNYSWSPSSDFVDPNVQNPIFSSGLTSSTTYTCTFISGGCVATDVVTITVNPLPTAALSAIPNPACLGESILLTASTSIPVNRYRFQFNNGGGWINMTNPGMSTSNPQIYNNISAITQFRVRVQEDNGCNTGAWSPVIVLPISIVATQPITHN